MTNIVRKSRLEIVVELRVRAIELSEAAGGSGDIPQPDIRVLAEPDLSTGVHWMLAQLAPQGASYVREAAAEIAQLWDVERRDSPR